MPAENLAQLDRCEPPGFVGHPPSGVPRIDVLALLTDAHDAPDRDIVNCAHSHSDLAARRLVGHFASRAKNTVGEVWEQVGHSGSYWLD